MIVVKDLEKYYGDFVALDGISFTANSGEITGFLGPNGAGKTTTMRIITNFLDSDAGSVQFDDKKVNNYSKDIAPDLGYLPENNALYKNLRVDEFLLFYSQFQPEVTKDELKEISDKCGLQDVLTKEIANLSKGYQQRVGLAKALIGNPRYVILDEPTSGLDPNQKGEILKLIKSLAKDKTILFSSHILSEVQEITNSVVIINKGQIVAEGKSSELIKEHFKGSLITLKSDAPLDKLKTQISKIEKNATVKSVKKGKDKMSTFEINASKDINIEIFKMIVKNKWVLSEIHKQEQGLEGLFKELTK